MAGKRAQKQYEVTERRTEVARLRLSGVRSQTAIARMLDVSIATINADFKALDAEWKQQATEYTDEYKALQNERYEALIAAHWEKAMTGKGFDTDRVLAAMGQQAKLLGLDAPVKQDIALDHVIREYVGLDPDDFDAESPEADE